MGQVRDLIAPDPHRCAMGQAQEHISLSGINGVLRPGIVHRLDKDTSGLLMIAKTDLAHRDLSAQIQAKTARRRYRALIHGHLTPDTGTITTHLARNPLVRNAVRVVPEHASGARLATTHWQVIATANAPLPETGRFTLLQLELDTGRTHQIRVHLSHLRHPVVGDPFYAKGAQPPKARWAQEGQLLQAFSLAFTHPVTRAPMHFELPPCLRLFQAADWLGVSWPQL
jgi:23S rRNA pseudouridine1911/1915/1917 synthase